MFPTIQIGTIDLSTYWLMVAVGSLGMMVCLLKRRTRFDLTKTGCAIFTVLLTLVGILGAKILYILEHIETVLKEGLTLGGVSFFGSVYLIAIVMPLVGRMFKMRSAQTWDVCAPCVAIMIGCIRVGCFLNGCCGGWECELFGFAFHWPTQAIESIGDFVMLSALLEREERGDYVGRLYPLFMMWYGVFRFFVEFLRDTAKDTLFMSNGQWFSLLAIFVGVLWIKQYGRRRAKI